MKNTIYLVTGAAGFLGSNVCSQLLEKGEKVRAFVIPNDPAAKFLPSQLEVIEGNLCDISSIENFMTIPEGSNSVVIHCASMVTVNPEYNQKLMDVNVGGTKNLVEVCSRHHECKKMVYVSSTGAIPEIPKGNKIKEVDYFEPINPDKVVGCYSQSKAKATQIVLDGVRHKGLNACIVHPSGILGPNDHSVSETTGTLIKIMKGEMPIGMQGSFNLCDVRDLASGCIAAVDKGKRGECYILGNEEVTLKQLCYMLHKESGCKKIKFYLPLGIANIIANFMEKKAKKIGTKPVMTTFSVYNLARNNAFDYTKAKKELGYTTRSYEQTIHDEVLWLKEEGMIA